MTTSSEAAVRAVSGVTSPNMGQWLERAWDDALRWMDTHTMEILIGAAVAAVIVVAMLGIRAVANRVYRRDPSLESWSSVIARTLGKTRTWFMIAAAAEIVSVYANAPGLLARTIHFLFTVGMVVQVAIWARAIILGFVEHRTQTDEETGETLGSAMKLIRVLVTAGVVAIAAIVVLDNLNVDVTGLVAGLGIGGIAIGLAAQGIFSDLFAALSIIFDKPFRKGDTISYDDTTASVEQIGLKSTRVRAFTGEERVISNTNLLDKEIQNLTRLDHRRIKFAIGVIYQTPPDRAAGIPALLRELVEAEGHDFVRSGFVGFGESSLDFELEFDVMSPLYEDAYGARHRVGIAILKRFNEEGLEFAYPTQTTFTAAPDGEMIMPYPDVKMVATDK